MADDILEHEAGQYNVAKAGQTTSAGLVPSNDSGHSLYGEAHHPNAAVVTPCDDGHVECATGQHFNAEVASLSEDGPLVFGDDARTPNVILATHNDSGHYSCGDYSQEVPAAVVTSRGNGHLRLAPSQHFNAEVAPHNDGGHPLPADEGQVPSAAVVSDQLRQMLFGDNPELKMTVGEIREQWRQRQAWHRAEKALTLQAKALCRRLMLGDKAEAEKVYKAALGKGVHPMSDIAFGAIFPLTAAKDGIEGQRKLIEKRLAKLAKQLPVADFVENTRGVGLLSLAAIIGEAGELSNYSTHSKLWKRLGLAVMPDGQRQRRVSGDAALEHGYSPARRSVVWNIGACMVKAGGPFKEVYDARKAYELTRVESKAHAHNRAQRYIEKKFIRALWREWTRQPAE